jgi:hypothetical protein
VDGETARRRLFGKRQRRLSRRKRKPYDGQRHALEAHGMQFSPEEVLQLVRAELGEATWQQRLGDETQEDAS